jgi:hypothetical protein
MANPQFSGALMSAVNQNNIALANISFEFPLIKIEAAKEYHGLGMALSPRRRENAEAGSLHRTARKLGSLFEQLIPPISVLAEAYGQRVSEIAAASINNFDVCYCHFPSIYTLLTPLSLEPDKLWTFFSICWSGRDVHLRSSHLWVQRYRLTSPSLHVSKDMVRTRSYVNLG